MVWPVSAWSALTDEERMTALHTPSMLGLAWRIGDGR
jgi:hypothetical protein